MRPTIWIGGASHALAFGKAFVELIKMLRKNFIVKTFGKNGATYADIQWPDAAEMQPGDIVLLFVFGNDMFLKNSHLITRDGGQKIIHLKSWRPQSEDHVVNMCASLDARLEKIPCRVFIVTAFFRHLFCCQKHRFPDMLRHQKRYNKIIFEYFQNKQNRVIIDHRKLVMPSRPKHVTRYRQKQPDSVHFSVAEYERMASVILDIMLV
jgi:lysophospholipase L1-like esterase